MRDKSEARPKPFFTQGAAGPDAPYRLLIISFHFPPDPEVGGMRWLKFARIAWERGFGVDVITMDPATLTQTDQSRLDDLPPHAKVYGVVPRTPWLAHIGRMVRARRARRRARADSTGAAAPAPRAEPKLPGTVRLEHLRWVSRRSHIHIYNACLDHSHWIGVARRAAEIGRRVVEPGRHVAIISSGPPHLAHEGARLLSARTGLPFVMDMRDPWTTADRLLEFVATPLLPLLARRYERRAISSAALIVANTSLARSALATRYPAHVDRMLTVMNGYDDDPLPPSPPSARFTIGFAGSIYIDRDPALLFRAVHHVIEDLRLSPDEFGIEFIGNVAMLGTRTLVSIAEEECVGAYVSVGGFRPRHEALAFLARATMLLSLPQDLELCVPAKLFEYSRFPAWILALAAPQSATALAFRDTGADVVAPSDVDAIAQVIRKRVLEFRATGRPQPIARDARLSRRHQAAILFDAIEERLAIAPPDLRAAVTVETGA
jgi:hypothetical protein